MLPRANEDGQRLMREFAEAARTVVDGFAKGASMCKHIGEMRHGQVDIDNMMKLDEIGP